MALRALPTAKALSPLLAESEAALAEVTAQLETRQQPEGELLQRLQPLWAQAERSPEAAEAARQPVDSPDHLVAQWRQISESLPRRERALALALPQSHCRQGVCHLPADMPPEPRAMGGRSPARGGPGAGPGPAGGGL